MKLFSCNLYLECEECEIQYFFSEIATKAGIVQQILRESGKITEAWIGQKDNYLKVNPFMEGLNRNSGLDAIRNSEFSKFAGNIGKTNSPIVLTDVTFYILINKELYLSMFFYISVDISSCSFDQKRSSIVAYQIQHTFFKHQAIKDISVTRLIDDSEHIKTNDIFTSLEFQLGVIKGSWYNDGNIWKCFSKIDFCVSLHFCQNCGIPSLNRSSYQSPL